MNTINKTANICFIGDIFIGQTNAQISKKILDVFSGSDLVVANFESPITDEKDLIVKKIQLKSIVGSEKKLVDWGINLVSLANNHVCDYGVNGLMDTIQSLKKANIEHVGAGKDIKQACAPVIKDINGIRIGFLAYAGEETQAKYATMSEFGCAPLEQELILNQIKQLKATCHHVIVIPHWGYCDYAYPTIDSVKLGEMMLEAGATAVTGHHSHILQGYRKKDNNSLIAYSLGNFMFGDFEYNGQIVRTVEENAEGAILQLSFDSENICEIRTHFTKQLDGLVCIDGNTEQRELKLSQRSAPMKSLDRYQTFWQKQVRKRIIRRLTFWIKPKNWKNINFATVKALIIMLTNSLPAGKRNA